MNARHPQLRLPDLTRLSDGQLVRSLEELVRQSRSTTAAILAHLIEVERRELHVAAACSSLFAYCTEVLGLSEGEAADRIHAARAAKRFPAVLEMLGRGDLHLTAVRLLAPRLDEDNHAELLRAAVGKTKREIVGMLADLAPKPDVPARIRKRPTRTSSPGSTATRDLFDPPKGAAAEPARPATAATARASADTSRGGGGRQRAPRPEPLGLGRHKVEFTATQMLVDKLELCQRLLSHRQPGCDVSDVIEQAVELLQAKLSRERFAVGAKPRRKTAGKRSGRANARRSRHVPAEVRREVVERDGLRCAYVDPKTGRRCSERSQLELQHHEPFALGGDHSAENISVYCRTHNRWAARRDFGAEHIDAAIERARGAPDAPAGRLPAR